MTPTVAEVTAMIAGAGSPFEVVTSTDDDGAVRSFANAPATLRDFFDLARGVEETFIVYEDEEWSFQRVMEHADALGDALVHRYAIAPGDRVAVAMRNLPEWVISFCAIVSVGAICVSLNAWWTEEELAYALDDARPRLVIADPPRVRRLLGPCQRAGTPIVAVRTPEGEEFPADVVRWDDVLSLRAALPRVELSASSDATILYTSGTTGFPKGAVSTHGAICQSIMAFAASVTIQAARQDPTRTAPDLPSVFILVVPLFHVTGCVPVMLSCFSWHFKLVMMHRWDPERALALIERHHVTTFVGVPTQSWDLLESAALHRYDTSSLRTVGGGGAPAPPTLVARVEHSFAHAEPTLAFGLTETNAYGPINSGDDYVTHPRSTGYVPTIVMDVEVRDEEGRVVAPDERGEIWVRSPTLIRAYWGKPEATADALVAGWLRTGDVGYVDPDGYLYIEDRAKDMILRGGENVYCAEVEAAIFEHPAVYEAAVVGVPDERLGEVVAAVVMLRDGAQLETDALHDFLTTRLASFKIPTRVVFLREPLPRNPAGKVMKRLLPSLYFD